MYVDTATYERSGKIHKRYLLRASYRENGKVKNSPYAKTLFSRKFTSSFIDAIFAATNNLYLIAK